MANILIVDDEELARFTLREILEGAGHQVAEAANGNECLAMQKSGDYDLVVTDIIMPDREGVETIIELRRDFPSIRIIAISGGGRTRNLDFLQIAKQMGADRALAKPFTDADLLTAVNEVLG